MSRMIRRSSTSLWDMEYHAAIGKSISFLVRCLVALFEIRFIATSLPRISITYHILYTCWLGLSHYQRYDDGESLRPMKDLEYRFDVRYPSGGGQVLSGQQASKCSLRRQLTCLKLRVSLRSTESFHIGLALRKSPTPKNTLSERRPIMT